MATDFTYCSAWICFPAEKPCFLSLLFLLKPGDLLRHAYVVLQIYNGFFPKFYCFCSLQTKYSVGLQKKTLAELRSLKKKCLRWQTSMFWLPVGQYSPRQWLQITHSKLGHSQFVYRYLFFFPFNLPPSISYAGVTFTICILASTMRRRSWWPSSKRSPAASPLISSCHRDPSSTAISWRCACVYLLDGLGASTTSGLLIVLCFLWRERLTWSSFPSLWLCPSSASTSWRPLSPQWVPYRQRILLVLKLLSFVLTFRCCCLDEKQKVQTASPHHGGSQGRGQGHCACGGDSTRVWHIWQEEVRRSI